MFGFKLWKLLEINVAKHQQSDVLLVHQSSLARIKLAKRRIAEVPRLHNYESLGSYPNQCWAVTNRSA